MEGKIYDTKSGAEAHQQYVMFYCVEGGGQIQESENGNLSLVSVAKKAVGDMKKGSLSIMMLAISSRVTWRIQ